MSGHSKWNNIKAKKGKTDAQRAKVFTKIGKEITMAVKSGGPEQEANSKLRDLIAKAKSLNVPKDNIDRIIKKASSPDTANYEEAVYEGYGPCGVAVMVETLTDNRNRTGGDMRHYFDKNGGNMGATGSVGWMFNKTGVIIIDGEGLDADTVMMDALDAGAGDFNEDDGTFEITTDAADVDAVAQALRAKGYTLESAEAEMIPTTYSKIEGEENIKFMNRLLEMLEDNDDVQNVWHNWEE